MQTLPQLLDRLLAGAHAISRWAVYLGGGAILLSSFLISIDVLARRFFGLSTWGADELSYYALAVSTSWACAYTLLVRAHIRIDLVTAHLPGRSKAIFHIIALLGLGYMAFAASGAMYHVFLRSWTRGSTSITTLQTPLWIPQGLFLAGLLFFTLVTALILLRVVVAIVIERDVATVNRVAGSVSIAEETEHAIVEASELQKGNS
ncbi:TRAP transporter small permease subunit [Chelativorans xinjiangense]|uniref:TRAP transporter small permease subunit n=1 Tax=Chelativorans xinjiangense TaxID=2681485 RepID=UPI0013599C8C|nr:TRAP transporter small permease [Chelativorans xinjiangense]